MRQGNYEATYLLDSEAVMSTNIAKPAKVAIIGASGTYGEGILARAEEIGVKAVVVTRSPDKFKDVKLTTTVVEAHLNEEEKLKEAFAGCDGVISALGDDRKTRPKTHNLPHVWSAMKAAGVTKYIGMGSGPMMMAGEKRGGFQCTVHALLRVLKFFGVDMLEQNEWEPSAVRFLYAPPQGPSKRFSSSPDFPALSTDRSHRTGGHMYPESPV
jgi:NADPH:quinone reductase-like Zn-dependent oxidoreductase